MTNRLVDNQYVNINFVSFYRQLIRITFVFWILLYIIYPESMCTLHLTKHARTLTADYVYSPSSSVLNPQTNGWQHNGFHRTSSPLLYFPLWYNVLLHIIYLIHELVPSPSSVIFLSNSLYFPCWLPGRPMLCLIGCPIHLFHVFLRCASYITSF